VDRDDWTAGIDQDTHDQARRPLDRDCQFSRRGDSPQPNQHVSQARGIVLRLDSGDDFAAAVNNADCVGAGAPVQTSVTWLMLTSLGCDKLTRAGRSCGSLTDRRSGWRALALHPVVRLDLPAPAARLVSCGPSSGERAWPSRQELGLPDTISVVGKAPGSPSVHQ